MASEKENEQILGMFIGLQCAVIHLSAIIAEHTEKPVVSIANSYRGVAEAMPDEMKGAEAAKTMLRFIAEGLEKAKPFDYHDPINFVKDVSH